MKEKITTQIKVLNLDMHDLKDKIQPTVWPISLEFELTFFT